VRIVATWLVWLNIFVVATLLLVFVVVMTAYDRVRNRFIRVFRPETAASEAGEQRRMNLDLAASLLIDEVLAKHDTATYDQLSTFFANLRLDVTLPETLDHAKPP